MKAVSAAALFLALGAAPVLAQQQYPYPSDTPPAARSQTDSTEQQAQTPQSDLNRPGDVETLRRDHMSSPNVTGESVPESPSTGVPEPQSSDNPGRLDSTPRP
jgi:hypothetical protein